MMSSISEGRIELFRGTGCTWKVQRWVLAAIFVAAFLTIVSTTTQAKEEPDILATGKLLGLPYPKSVCELRDLDENEIYLGVKFSVVNLEDGFEITETGTLESIFKGLRETIFGSSEGIFTVFAKVLDHNNEVISIFPVYRWDSKTKRDTITEANSFTVINYRPAEDIPNLKLAFDVRYTKKTETAIFENIQRVLTLAATAYSGGIGSSLISLGTSKLKDASEYDRQLKHFLSRSENYVYRPVVFSPLDFQNDGCIDEANSGSIELYTDLGTNRPKRGVFLVVSGKVSPTDKPIIATLELTYRTSYMLDRINKKFADLPLVAGIDRAAMVAKFIKDYTTTTNFKEKLERKVTVVDPQKDPTQSHNISIEKFVLDDRMLQLRSKFSRLKSENDTALIGEACADLMRVIEPAPLTLSAR